MHVLAAIALVTGSSACTRQEPRIARAELILHNARVYTQNWDAPSPDGRPGADAPFDSATGWHPDASAIAIAGGQLLVVGSDTAAFESRGPDTRVIDMQGAVILPGFVDAHTHVAEMGQALDRVNLTGITTEAEAVAKIEARAATTPKGEWIIGYGWDEGAWANHYPDRRLISQRVPDHPVLLRGLHGFAAWANDLALRQAGITRDTKAPVGGEIRRDARGEPTGLLLNRAVPLLDDAVPQPTPAQRDAQVLRALHVMANAGFTGIHEAGVAPDVMASFERLASRDSLPLRVHAMLSGRDSALIRAWIRRGPYTSPDRMLSVRAVKAYYDGALGSRGAQLLADYSDQPGHRGIAGSAYGFDHRVVGDAMAAGFQVGIHAIGDAGNRASLDFIDSVMRATPGKRDRRHRIEHAQVVSPQDLPRFRALGIIASMQPPHAVEDKGWAESRLGAQRIRGAYAWRSLRQAGASVAFSSDLPGSDFNLFYGLHSAITRQDTTGAPAGGWYPGERMTAEEAVRGYTRWNAYAGFDETEAGMLMAGFRADLTVIDVDPFRMASPRDLLTGKVLMTGSRGRITAGRPPAP
ncbi:MAG: amidohydrolase [Gemmatimonadaceae bacterium]|nr:amidohydrolase [Gemmatimonadaceae bacterium]